MTHQFAFEGFTCAVLDVGHFIMSADVLFPEAPPEDRDSVLHRHGLVPDHIVFRMHPLLIDTGQQRVLVDPGTSANDHGNPANLLAALRSIDVDPASINSVIVTHCHPDHYSGAATASGEPVFPRARYYLHPREWAYWTAADNPETDFATIFRQLLLPIQDRITLLDGDGDIVPGIRLMPTPGHSPGHAAVLVGERLIYVGDVLLTVVHVERPAWTATFDRWPEDVVQSRCGLLQRAATDDLLVATYHFPLPGLGRVRPDGDTWRWIAEEITSG